jgi:hypothetical protein
MRVLIISRRAFGHDYTAYQDGALLRIRELHSLEPGCIWRKLRLLGAFDHHFSF